MERKECCRKCLRNRAPGRHRALLRQVGVGTSTLQLDMVLDGYQSITNVDYSSVVIAQMRELHRNVRGLRYAVADCRRVALHRPSVGCCRMCGVSREFVL